MLNLQSYSARPPGSPFAYGALGYSYHAVQDYALMRTLPNMLNATPGDPMEMRTCMRYLVENPSPSYLRLGKAGEPNFHAAPPECFAGLLVKVRSGNAKRTLLSTGAVLQIAMDWAVEDEHVDRMVYTMPLWSMADIAAQIEPLGEFEEVVTLEDQLEAGGFGSWLFEAKVHDASLDCILRPVSLSSEVCGTVSSQATLNRLGGLQL